MHFISLNKVKPGMRNAFDIFNAKGHKFINGGRRLKQEDIDDLLYCNYYGIYVLDNITDNISPEFPISLELRKDAMLCLYNGNYDKCINFAEKIVNELYGRNKIILDLIDVKSQQDYIYQHSVNTAVISCIIGMEMKLPSTQLKNLVLAGLLHDIGKLYIPAEILNKRERLSQEEYTIVKSHPEKSFQKLKLYADISDEIKDIVLHHHENIDGSGYPDGTIGSEQSLLTKILHVADVYDAMTSERPFKKAYSFSDVLEYMMGGCGILFDKDVVNALKKHVPLYPLCADVYISNGKMGVVIENDGRHDLRPVIRVLDGFGQILDLSYNSNLGLAIKSCASRDDDELIVAEESRNKMISSKARKRIMVVDDMKTNLSAIKEILESDYHLTLLISGKQAISYISSNPYPDLILMDIDMPDMNGIETTIQIMHMTNNMVPILFVSSHCDKETVMTCRKLNASGYIARPYNAVFMKEEIYRILYNTQRNI